MRKLLFVYDHKYPDLWRDGLWAALKLLENDFDITYWNLREQEAMPGIFDFVLGWGALNSPVDKVLAQSDAKKGLCIGGSAFTETDTKYDVLFYETEWFGKKLDHPNKFHAFGINSDIYTGDGRHELIDYLTVGSFANWKRQTLLKDRPGFKMAVGEIQEDNPQESMPIIAKLLANRIAVCDMVAPEKLAEIYSSAITLYIPADINGGGERAVLEGRSCGCLVEVEEDNPKLQELLTSPIYDHHYYYEQLKKGIERAK
jgi:hypothetical protein